MQKPIAIAAAAVLVSGLSAAAYVTLTAGPEQCSGSTIAGGKAAIGGPFELVKHTGETVTDTDVITGPTLIYFGFTYCPDVCPTSLLLMETALENVGPDAAQKVNVVFITIDPERDTPELLKGYVPNFGSTFIGLTGTPQQIADVARAYRVYFQKVPSKDGGPYLMDHSSIIYLLDRNGRFVTHFTHDAKAEAIAAAVGRLI